MSVAVTWNVPDLPSSGANLCPSDAGASATALPDTNETRYVHLPALSGATCARHLLPDVADELAASPSPAKYPGTRYVGVPDSWANVTVMR